MPKENIERAIKRGTGGDGEIYDEVRYEGYGPGGVAVIVETLTDNRNRTAAEVRNAFTKLGGSLGESGSVSFQFDQLGEVRHPAEVTDAETFGVFQTRLPGTAARAWAAGWRRTTRAKPRGATHAHHRQVYCDRRGAACGRDRRTGQCG